MLNAVDLVNMRAVQEAALPETCAIQARSLIGDGQGGQRETWGEGVSVACRVAPMSKEDVARYADKLGASSGWVITLPYNTTVAVYDRITTAGVEYRVVGTNENESWITARRAYCARLK